MHYRCQLYGSNTRCNITSRYHLSPDILLTKLFVSGNKWVESNVEQLQQNIKQSQCIVMLTISTDDK